MNAHLLGWLAIISFFGTRSVMAETPMVLESGRDIPVVYEVDVVVIGGSTGAVAAAVQAAQSGATVFLAAPRPYLGRVKPERSRFELKLLREALRRDLPVLGICGGMQLINVALGGTLFQDILQERPDSRDHQQKNRKDRTSHRVTISPDTRLGRIVRGGRASRPIVVGVNSTHHQAVRDVPAGLTVNARAGDGVIEGIESERHTFVLGVQWHPELLYRRQPAQRRILRALVSAAGATRRRR